MKALTQNEVTKNILKVLEMVRSGEEIIIKNNPMDLIYMRCSIPETKQTTKKRVFTKREKGTYNITISKLIGQLMHEIYKNKARISGPFFQISKNLNIQGH